MATLPTDRDQLADACDVLKRTVGATNESLLVALYEDAGVSVRRSAQVLGMKASWAHDRLDLEAALDPEPDWRTLPRPFRRARSVVWLAWLSVLAVGVIAVLQAQGGIVPCPDPVCIDAVDLLVAPDEVSDALVPSQREPDDVVGLRYEHRSQQVYRGTLEWRIDGEIVQAQGVAWGFIGDATVLWQGGSMPPGVHRITITDANGQSVVERSSVTFVVRRLPPPD